MRRRNNQDSFAVIQSEDESAWQRNGHLLIVADGMGAHAAGELASRLSVELIPHHFGKLNRGVPSEALQRALVETNSEIFRRGQANPEFRSMGTTTCALGIFPEGAVIAHVGDSRVYRLRGQVFEQLTFDHSLVWEMQASGDMSEEAIQNNAIPKNVITRSLGPNASVAVDLEGPFPLKNGDKYLICSDGLSGQLTDEEIGVLLQVLDLQLAVDTMVHLANLRGGPDNITVVVGQVIDETRLRTSDTPEKNTNFVAPSYPVAFGVVTAICFLTCVVMLLLGQIPIALLAAGAAAIAFATGWFKYQALRTQEVHSDQYGKAPYRKCTCKPDVTFASKLANVIEELNDWVRENDWKINLPAIEEHSSRASAAISSKNYAEAIRNFAQVISLTMAEVRRTQKEKPGDSNVEL